MEELDLALNIRALAIKRPYKFKEAWRKYACDLQDIPNRSAKLNKFVDFVNQQAECVLHSLYGNIEENILSTKELHQQRLKYRKEWKPKSQKVFTTEIIYQRLIGSKSNKQQ